MKSEGLAEEDEEQIAGDAIEERNLLPPGEELCRDSRFCDSVTATAPSNYSDSLLPLEEQSGITTQNTPASGSSGAYKLSLTPKIRSVYESFQIIPMLPALRAPGHMPANCCWN